MFRAKGKSMKTILCALWLMVFGSGCAYFRWESDRPWNAPLNSDGSPTRSSSFNQLNDSRSPSRTYK